MNEKRHSMVDTLAALSGKAPSQKTLEVAAPVKRYARDGKAGWNTYHDPAVIAQIKIVCAEQGLSQQEFAREAINIMFAKYGKGQIA